MTTVPVISAKIDQTHEAEALEALGEFDHGIGDFSNIHGKEAGEGGKEHSGPPPIQIKPKEVLQKAEKAVEGVIKSVLEKTGSARKVASESKVREEVEAHTEEEVMGAKMCVSKVVHKESFEAP